MAKKKKTGPASPENPYGLPTQSVGSVSAGSGVYTPSKPQGAKFNGLYDRIEDRPIDDSFRQGESLYQKKYQTARENKDVAGMKAANEGMNQLRNDYGLAAVFADADINYIKGLLGKETGDKPGGGTTMVGSAGGSTSYPSFSYESAPEFVSQWEGLIQDLTDQLLNRPNFSYDHTQDPLYQQYADIYTREGQRAMLDTLGAVSARTGGLASSYATSAANQANNYYMSQLSDKIPELQQLAYSMYQDQGNQLMNMLNMVTSLEQGDYAKFQDQLNQWNTDRNFNYGLTQDKIANDRYEKEWAYQLQQDQYGNNLDMAALLASVGDYSGYANLWGLSDAQTQALIDQYAKDQSLSDREAAMALADWRAQYGDFSGLRDLGIDTSYLERKQGAELSKLYGGGGDGVGGDPDGGTLGIIDTMLGYGDDVKAYEYLLGKGLTVSATEQLWEMYQEMAGEEGEDDDGPGDGGYNDSYFKAAMNSISMSLQQGNEDVFDGVEQLWNKLSPSQKQQLQTLLGRFGYTYQE